MKSMHYGYLVTLMLHVYLLEQTLCMLYAVQCSALPRLASFATFDFFTA